VRATEAAIATRGIRHKGRVRAPRRCKSHCSKIHGWFVPLARKTGIVAL